jgi:CrcB protein
VSGLAWVAFTVAAASGAVVRYLVGGLVADRTEDLFPWGTFVVNVTGSFLSGLLTGLALYHAFPATPRVVLVTGFCGAYTTFSTFTFETVRLIEEGAGVEAMRNIGASVLVAVLAAGTGLALASL